MVAAGNGAAAGFATGAFYAIVDEEVLNVYFGAVDQEVECMLSVRSPDAFQVCKLCSFRIGSSNSLATPSCARSGCRECRITLASPPATIAAVG